MDPLLHKFTTHLKQVLTRALHLAVERGEPMLRPSHLLWALAAERGCVAAEVLQKQQITPESLEAFLSRTMIGLQAEKKDPGLSAEAQRAIEKAVLTASVYDHAYIGTEHLLSGILQVRDADLIAFFELNHIDLQPMQDHVAVVLKTASRFPELIQPVLKRTEPSIVPQKTETEGKPEETKKMPALEYFARELTHPQVVTTLDPMIGRESELQRVMEILCRRTKNNPLLLGEPGVGKTAIVEGLAQAIASNTAPAPLRGKRIFALDLALMVAGTMYRGEFEGRLRQLIEEVRTHEDVIVFIDELHTIVGAGSASGSLDAANVLKPALARGEMRCIGATTYTEFKKHLESDAALERRFQSLMVEEPSLEVATQMLEGVAKRLEQFHHVHISQDAIRFAVEQSSRHLPDRQLPDKAIDLVDEAAAALRVRHGLQHLKDQIREVETQLREVRDQKRQAVSEEAYANASELAQRERRLSKTIEHMQTQHEIPATLEVAPPQIADILSRMTGIPVVDLVIEERERLRDLESALGRRIIGQEEVVRAVSDAVRRAKLGLQAPGRPLASFLFLGPSGVGKTELARVLAEVVYQNPKSLIRLDMSEFAEGFTASKLLGAPAGYVGYREGNKLTDHVRQRPHSIVLFDEIEKAHRDVQNLLLQILDHGEISDATGKRVSFRNAIIILTSNVGLERLQQRALGFADGDATQQRLAQEDIRKELEQRFRPELINRLDRLCVFQALSATHLQQIAELHLTELAGRLVPKGLVLRYDVAVAVELAARAQKDPTGARAIPHLIQQHIEPILAGRLLRSSHTKTLRLSSQKGHFRLTA